MSIDPNMISPELPEDAAMRPPTISVEKTSQGATRLTLSGVWTTRALSAVDDDVERMVRDGFESNATLDFSAIEAMDTAGAWLIVKLRNALVDGGHKSTMAGAKDDYVTLIEAVGEATKKPEIQEEVPHKPGFLTGLLAKIGEGVLAMRRDVVMGLHILGATVHGSQMKEGRVNRVSFAPIASQIDKMGIQAMPIIALMAAIIGAIIAQQGAFQLRYFGAEIFVVDLVSILVLREIGVLITAIMIAGRSGSAITAEIGSMRMREEVDALTVIGLNPVAVLVFPRLIALIIALPLLTFMANLAALAGAMVVADFYSGISYETFINRLRVAVDLTSLFSGLIKAPFMAIIIAVIASVEGMKVGGSAESLGKHVTASVVKAIFVVIVVDGIFAIFYAAIDF